MHLSILLHSGLELSPMILSIVFDIQSLIYVW